MRPTVAVTLLTDDIHFVAEQRQRLREFAEVRQYAGDTAASDSEKVALMQGAEGAIVGRSGGGLTKEIIEACPKLRVVGVIGGAVRHVEPEFLLEQGIALINTAPGFTDAVAEFSLTLILNTLRDLSHMIEVTHREGWGQERGGSRNLADQTVALIGYGLIGQRLRELLQPFRCTVLVYDPYASPEVQNEHDVALVSLDEALSRAEVISLHAGLTLETEGMIGERELALVQDGALIVNTARGRLLDEAALTRELQTGRIFASLNVFAKEPLPMDSPLRGLPNVILTPHGGGRTTDTFRIQSELIVDDLRRFFAGETPSNVVTREMLGRMT